jgi:putative ABC transport system permease protein
MRDKTKKKTFGIAKKILGLCFTKDQREVVYQDFDEHFQIILEEKGVLRARFWYLLQTMKIIRGKIFNTFFWGLPILNNYLRITFRNIRAHKTYSIINLAGLSIGIVCAITVLLFVQDEFKYDKFHKNKDYIYRVTSKKLVGNNYFFLPRAPWPVGKLLKERFPQVKNFTRFLSYGHRRIQLGEKVFLSRYDGLADPSFFDIFTFHYIYGNKNSALKDPSSVVLTESFAKKCFGKVEVLGEIIKIGHKDRKVTGVIKDVPYHSHLRFEFLVPLPKGDYQNEWRGGPYTYLLMNKKIDLEEFNKLIKDIIKEYNSNIATKLSLQPLHKVHLYSNFLMDEHDEAEFGHRGGDIKYIYILSLAVFFILLIVSVNYMNLSTAMADFRAREIGVKKILGARKQELIRQFLGESVILAFISLLLALILLNLMLPIFNQFSGKSLGFSDIFSMDTLGFILVITLFIGLLSGSYPAFFLSSFRSIEVIRRTVFTRARGGIVFRKILVVFQFSIAILIIVVTLVFYKQFNFIQAKYSGFNLENTIVAVDWTFARHHEVVTKDLLANPDVISVSHSKGPGNGYSPSSDVHWEGKDPQNQVRFGSWLIDYEYLKVFRAKLVAGRFFSKEIKSDESNFILNETAVKVMGGAGTPIGKKFSFKGVEGTIIGVFQDRHFGPLNYQIKPLVFQLNFDHPRFNIKVKDTKSIPATLKYIDKIRKKFPNYKPVFYRFAEDDLAVYSKKEKTLSFIFTYITALTIFLACLGLVGLSAFHVGKKTKEIGIRKIHGATIPSITVMLTTEFIKWVLLANLISWPLAYFIMNQWLQDYVYRIKMGPGMFLTSAVLAILIAILTVSFQTLKAARLDPVHSLKCE